jgi:hypothetical protein
MLVKELKERLRGLPPSFIKSLTKEQVIVIMRYESRAKLGGVLRWKQRIARAGIKSADVARLIKREPSRLSEWIHFKYEPEDLAYDAVEGALYKLGA